MSNLQVGIVRGSASGRGRNDGSSGSGKLRHYPSFRQLDGALRTMASRKMLFRFLTPVV